MSTSIGDVQKVAYPCLHLISQLLGYLSLTASYLNLKGFSHTMSNDRVSMPQSGGGLMRYFDDYKSRIQINKTWVIVAIVLVIIVELVLQKGM